jgi:putative ABC transport system permease protein
MGDLKLWAIFFYARKDIEKNKKTFFLIILAISLVNANIIILNGFTDGMINEFIDKTMETSSGHLNIYPEVKDHYIEGLGIKELKLEKIGGIEAASPRLTASGALSFKENSKPITIMALDPLKENRITLILRKLDSGQTLLPEDKTGVLISYRLADELGAKAGDYVTLLFEKGSIRVYRIRGVIRTGMEMDKDTVIINFNEASEQLDINNKASMILVKLQDRTMAENYRNIISKELEVSRIKIWTQEIEAFVSSMDTFKQIADAINIIGLFAAAVLIGIILYINIQQKKRQIGIMKAIGLKDSQVFSVYLIEALLLGLIGIFIGSILGYSGTKYLEAHPFYDPVLGAMGPRFQMYLIYDASIVVILTVLVAVMYPAMLAGRISIMKAIWGK